MIQVKYKNIISGTMIIAVVFFLSIIFCTPAASTPSSTTLEVDILKYEPFPAEIGEYISVWIKVDNFAAQKSDDVTIKIVPEYPFTVDSPQNSQKNIGILPPGNTGIHEFRLFVDRNANPGVGTIKIRYQGQKDDIWLEESFDIRVGADTFDSRGTLELVSSGTTPAVMMPGDKGTLVLEMRNSAATPAVILDGKEFDTKARIQIASLGSNEHIKVISDSYRGDGVLGPGDTINIYYTIEVSNNAPVGTYLIDLSMIGNSHSYNTNWQIPVKVDSQSSLKVIPAAPLVLEDGEGTLEFDVANVHSAALSAVSVRLESDNMDFSPKEYFIGTMESDELFTIDISTEHIEGLNSSNTVNVIASYRNGQNTHEYIVDSLEVRLVDSSSGPGAGTFVLILLVIIGGAGLIYYKKRSMKDTEKDKKE